MLLAVDPSVRSPGAAIFCDSVLVAVARIPCKRASDVSDGQRWLDVATQIRAWVGARQITSFIFEKPQIYTAFKSKGDPNDLIGLAGIGAALAGMLGVSVLSPTPAEWIGQLPKSTRGSALDSPRSQRIVSRLSPAELALVPDQHDAIDAVGLGLWALGRLKPHSVFSNGRDGTPRDGTPRDGTPRDGA